jgi:hypothetical protein
MNFARSNEQDQVGTGIMDDDIRSTQTVDKKISTTQELKQVILFHLENKTTTNLRATGTNLLSLLRKRVIIPLMPMNMSALSPPDINKQLTNEQQKEIGRQIVQNIRAALRLGDPVEAQILRAMVELNFYPDEFLGEEREQLADYYGRDVKHLPHHNAVGSRPSRDECASIVRTKYYDAHKKVDNELKRVKKEIATKVDKDIIQLSTVLVDEEDSIDSAGDAKNANVSARPRIAGLSSHNNMPTRQQLLTAAYENDITLQQLLEEKEELVSSMDHETDVQFSNELYEYNKYTTQHAEYTAAIQRYEKAASKLETLEIALCHYTLCIQCITQLLMDHIGRYPAIQKLLFGSATIPATGEIIQGPFQNGNLSGMYAILVKTYMSPSVVDFIHTLSKTVRLRMDDSTSLRAALIRMDSIMHTWENMQYWKYMNPDIFFTMVYLDSLPASLQDARDKAMYYVLQRLQETEHSRGSETMASSQQGSEFNHLTLFNEVRSFMERLEDSQKLYTPGANKTRYGGFQQREGQTTTERAHAASEVSTRKIVDPNKPFTKEVTFADNFATKNINGRVVSYSATKEPCPQCAGGDPAKQHNPPCYPNKCFHCSYYGHNRHQCNQATSKKAWSSGAPAASKAAAAPPPPSTSA